MTTKELKQELHNWTERSMIPAMYFKRYAKLWIFYFQEQDSMITENFLYEEMCHVYGNEEQAIPEYRLQLYEKMFYMMKWGK